MDQQKKLAFRILASLYPDRRPSEIKKIIDDALAKEERTEDIELWMALTNEKPKEEKITEKKIVEEHHYHHYDRYYPYWYNTITQPWIDKYTITCGDSITGTDSSTTTVSSDYITISSNNVLSSFTL